MLGCLIGVWYRRGLAFTGIPGGRGDYLGRFVSEPNALLLLDEEIWVCGGRLLVIDLSDIIVLL